MFANPLLAFLNFQAQQNNSLQMRGQAGFHNPPIIPPPPAAAEAAAAEEEPSEEQVPPLQQPLHINQVQQPIEMQVFTQNPIEHHLRLSSFLNSQNRSFEVENIMLQEKIYPVVEPSFIEEPQKEYKSLKPLTQVSKTSKKISKPKAPKLTRKIVKNFGKAIASFACSEKALQIIEKSFRDCDRKKFKDFVYEHKECIEGNRRFKQLLTVSNDDPLETRDNKRIFKKISEVFMKTYVHQWIWNSKLLKKEDHAQLVSEMKKRIQNPSLLESLSN